MHTSSCEGKVHPITDHEVTDVMWRYSSTLSLTSALDGVSDQRHAPAAVPPGKKHDTNCRGGCVGPRVGLDGCGICRPTGIRYPESPGSSESLYRLSYSGPIAYLDLL